MRPDVRSSHCSPVSLCSLGVALTLALLPGCSGGGSPAAQASTSGASAAGQAGQAEQAEQADAAEAAGQPAPTKPAPQATLTAEGDTSAGMPASATDPATGSADGPQAGGSMDTTTGGDGEVTTGSDAATPQPVPAEAAPAPTKPAPSPTKPAPAPTKPAPAEAAPAPTKPASDAPASDEPASDEPAPTLAEAEPPPPSGEALYLRRCKGCHGADGAAQTTMGKTYGVDSLVGTKLSRAKIIKVLEDGVEGTKMRSFSKKLTPEEMKRVADHVKTL